MSRTPSDRNTPHSTTVRRDSPFPTLAIVLAIAIVMLVGLALFSPLRDRLFVAPAPDNRPADNRPADSAARSASQSAPPASAPEVAAPAPAPPAQPTAPVVVETPLTLMPATPPPQPVAAPAAPTGEAGLVEALRIGQLGLATGGDFSRWSLRWSEANRRGVPQSFMEMAQRMDTYVIRKDFTIPDGLTGAHAVVFILDKDVPFPRGKPGHSTILDITSGACVGTLCYRLTEQ